MKTRKTSNSLQFWAFFIILNIAAFSGMISVDTTCICLTIIFCFNYYIEDVEIIEDIDKKEKYNHDT